MEDVGRALLVLLGVLATKHPQCLQLEIYGLLDLRTHAVLPEHLEHHVPLRWLVAGLQNREIAALGNDFRVQMELGGPETTFYLVFLDDSQLCIDTLRHLSFQVTEDLEGFKNCHFARLDVGDLKIARLEYLLQILVNIDDLVVLGNFLGANRLRYAIVQLSEIEAGAEHLLRGCRNEKNIIYHFAIKSTQINHLIL